MMYKEVKIETKGFCEFLREQAMETINSSKKKNEVFNKRGAEII